MPGEVPVPDGEPTREQLDALLRLQDGDTTIRRLEHRLDNLPEQQALDETEQKAQTVRMQRDELAVELDRVRSRVSKLEGEVDMLRQRRDADQSRMYSGQISNPRELQALRADVESTERRIGEHEDELLEAMEEREQLESQLDTLETRQLELDERLAASRAARDDAAGELLSELEQARSERDNVRGDLPDGLLADYDRLSASGPGMAVGRLDHGMCTACRIELPRIDVSELRGGPPLARCPECDRLLVVRS